MAHDQPAGVEGWTAWISGEWPGQPQGTAASGRRFATEADIRTTAGHDSGVGAEFHSPRRREELGDVSRLLHTDGDFGHPASVDPAFSVRAEPQFPSVARRDGNGGKAAGDGETRHLTGLPAGGDRADLGVGGEPQVAVWPRGDRARSAPREAELGAG